MKNLSKSVSRLMKIKIIILFLLFSVFSNAQFVKKHGQLKVLGTQLVDQNNEPIMLRGMSYGWHSLWPRFYNKESINKLIVVKKPLFISSNFYLTRIKKKYKIPPRV